MAGGCEGWCVREPPISKAEMYDPATDEWTTLPNLPFPISQARMENVDGKPTIIGGYTKNTPKESKVVERLSTLVSYDVENNQWIVDGKINVPRSSFATIQIPKSFIPGCFT